MINASDTEGSFSSKRIREIAGNICLNYQASNQKLSIDHILSKILVYRAFDHFEQLACIRNLKNLISKSDLGVGYLAFNQFLDSVNYSRFCYVSLSTWIS